MADRPRTPGPWIRWGPVGLVAAAIFVGSVTRPGGAGGLLGPFGLLGVDKYLHALSFAALAVTLAVALPSTATGRALVVVVAAAAGYGLLIEVVQWPIPYRTFSLADLAADAAGAGLAALLWHGYRRRGRRRDRNDTALGR